ncbi:MAG: M1 family aminopeptidase [Pseudohongiella sp.]|nr:M1 family aminopeptidase [Pseudohongiella sp.]
MVHTMPTERALTDHPHLLAAGVPQTLAQLRSAAISDVVYKLHFDVPASAGEPVRGEVDIRFTQTDMTLPIVLDFRAPAEQVTQVLLNGESAAFNIVTDHIVIPSAALQPGEQRVSVSFQSTDAALNRQQDFMYALFVPDRASTAFPVFEQPDIKARYELSLTIPSHWQALANGALQSRTPGASDPSRHQLLFAQTLPISSYLFAFAAGELQTETAERDGRTFTMYHRETDAEKLARNRDAIFDLHATALSWLEDYTGIDYPFGKFDFFAVPAFQFGGMEHPGAIWYRAETLFLDPTASRTQELGRASLIAHETAHMWFGDLVTMRWFDDVWMKEVFANFMAAKIAGPSFPDLNMPLRFFQAHHPTAYGVDRTAGANPVRQPLANLRDAGSLYGAIIYQKAPVVMQQLEQLIGEAALQEGLRQYLQAYQFGNASWTDLINMLDAISDQDLLRWSRAWVDEPGRPRIKVRWTGDGIEVSQLDDNNTRGLHWQQRVSVLLGSGDSVTEYFVDIDGDQAQLALPGVAQPDFILPGSDGISYGRFELDEQSVLHLLRSAARLENPLHRAVSWQSLWEEVLDQRLPAIRFFDALTAALSSEQDELVTQQMLGSLRNTFWRFLAADERLARAAQIEQLLWQGLEQAPTAGQKGAWFNAVMDVTLTESGVSMLEKIWRMNVTPAGLPLQEQQYITLAEALALREVPQAQAILDEQQARISNPDRLARFEFVRPAFSTDPAERRALFDTFSQLSNRRVESWVLDAQRAINHPLRAETSLVMLPAALTLSEEIQRTGDIFFPLRWLNATLDGHSSAEAAQTVRQFLQQRTDLPAPLRAKILQASDDLFRMTD